MLPAYHNTQSCSVKLTFRQEFSVGVPDGPTNRRIFNGGHAFAMPDLDAPHDSRALLLCSGREIDNNTEPRSARLPSSQSSDTQ